MRMGPERWECAIDRRLVPGGVDTGDVGSRAAIQSLTWASLAVSPPSASLDGKVWRQMGQISLSCRRGRGEMKGLEEGEEEDDA
jgi:hypothetical protein